MSQMRKGGTTTAQIAPLIAMAMNNSPIPSPYTIATASKTPSLTR